MGGIRRISAQRMLHDIGKDGVRELTSLMQPAHLHHTLGARCMDLMMVLEVMSPTARVSMVWDPGFGGGWYVDVYANGGALRGRHKVLIEALWQVVVPLIGGRIHHYGLPLVASQIRPFGERLRAAMRQRHMTIKALAGVVGLHPSVVVRYRGAVDGGGLRHVDLLADALGVTPQWLLGHGPDCLVVPVEGMTVAAGGGPRRRRRGPRGITRRSGKIGENRSLV